MLYLLASGASNREIAHRLAVTQADVRNHVSDILSKLHLASRTEAVLYALREGLASLDDLAPSYFARLLAMLGETVDYITPGDEESIHGASSLPEDPSKNELQALRLIAADPEKVGEELALAGKSKRASYLNLCRMSRAGS